MRTRRPPIASQGLAGETFENTQIERKWVPPRPDPQCRVADTPKVSSEPNLALRGR